MNYRTPAVATGAALTALLTAGLLAGCSASGTGGTSGMDHGSTASSAGHNSADVMFAQMMVPHHEQAIEMSDMLLKKDGADPRVRDLAQRIKDEQTPEIATMKGWLKDWGSGSSSGMGGMDHGGGMMSDSDMAALEKADGATAGPLFLTQMTAHHEGAITMARTESKNGKDSEALALARNVIATQTAEISEMKDLAASLG